MADPADTGEREEKAEQTHLVDEGSEDKAGTEAGAEDKASAEAGAEEKAGAPRDKPRKKKGKSKSKSKAKAIDDREGSTAEVKEHAKAGADDSRANLLGHAVIWLGVLGSVAYLMARGP
jgi:hypothetical protein